MRSFVQGLVAVAFASSLFVAGGCKKDPTCENAMNHAFDVMMKDKDMAAMMKDKKADEVKKMKEEGVKECKDKKTSKADLECVMKANSMEAIEKCDKGDKKDEKKDEDKK